MIRPLTFIVCAVVLSSALADVAQAQRRNPRGNQAKEEKPKYPPLPDDKRLMVLHKKFVDEAEKLAGEYVRAKQLDKASDVYKEILKLVPQLDTVREKLYKVREMQGSASRSLFTVRANLGWQDTGVVVEAGKPITIRAAGSWTFTLKKELDPDGIEIPKELRDFPLGSLVAIIQTGDGEESKPFVVGSEKSFDAKHTGLLMLRMYDIDPSDNDGVLKVQITGTFKKR